MKKTLYAIGSVIGLLVFIGLVSGNGSPQAAPSPTASPIAQATVATLAATPTATAEPTPTATPAPTPVPTTVATPKPTPTKSTSSCDPNYSGACVPIASDVDCAGGSGDGPAYVVGQVKVIGTDIYRLDGDRDGYGCDK